MGLRRTHACRQPDHANQCDDGSLRFIAQMESAACCSDTCFWKRGLESPMIAHFFADIGLQVIAPALAR
jgi:hypothetical protein